MSSCLVVQHLEPESSYAIGEALASVGIEVDQRLTDAAEPLPETLDGFDGLVVMGGPMSADSDDGFPTRRQELTLLAEAVERGLPTLGVCLGAQLLAAATGGRILRGASGPEIGWAPVRLHASAADDLLLASVLGELSVLHWHGDTFDLPPGGVLLASNDRYDHQAFRIGPRAWGFQFHLEVDREAVAAFAGSFGADLDAVGITPDNLLDATPAELVRLEVHRRPVLARFAALVGARPVGVGDADRAVRFP
ncbi:MAG: type 1 glutamine amidotransferase [Acidimicrobiales bacterium]|jgi:GMP synthase-like glutamine amidotransferase